MSTLSYKCPCCASPLTYDGGTGKLSCAACGNTFEPADLEAMEMDQQGDQLTFEVDADSYTEADAMDAYHCKSCGAQLVCENTTTATECPYCGSPTILPDRIQGGVKPEKVVPFLIGKEQAEQMFHGYFKGKRLLPNVFIKTDNHIHEVRKLYVPYWLFDCGAEGDFIYDAEKKREERSGEWKITHTEHYAVRRTGTLDFSDIPVDGSEKMNPAIAESLEPYDLDKAVPFQSAVLSGAMADRADIAAEDCKDRAAQRVKTTTEQTLRSTVTGYSSVSVRRGSVRTEHGKATPVLLPAWIITTVKEEKNGPKTYTFAINGQSGQLTCDVPYDRAKFWTWLLGLFVVIMAIGCGVLALMDAMASGSLMITGIVALIISLAVVFGMAAKLKTAAKQAAASNYVVKNSLNLSRRIDQYLYTTTTREKIEQPKKA